MDEIGEQVAREGHSILRWFGFDRPAEPWCCPNPLCRNPLRRLAWVVPDLAAYEHQYLCASCCKAMALDPVTGRVVKEARGTWYEQRPPACPVCGCDPMHPLQLMGFGCNHFCPACGRLVNVDRATGNCVDVVEKQENDLRLPSCPQCGFEHMRDARSLWPEEAAADHQPVGFLCPNCDYFGDIDPETGELLCTYWG